jgi:cytoskeletal protein RodZ
MIRKAAITTKSQLKRMLMPYRSSALLKGVLMIALFFVYTAGDAREEDLADTTKPAYQTKQTGSTNQDKTQKEQPVQQPSANPAAKPPTPAAIPPSLRTAEVLRVYNPRHKADNDSNTASIGDLMLSGFRILIH